MNLSETKHEINLARWKAIITECRGSGIPIKTWCRNNQINIKTYYYWQKRVWDKNISPKPTKLINCPDNTMPATFVEYKLPCTSSPNVAITVRLEYAVLEIHNGADELAIASTMRALKNLC